MPETFEFMFLAISDRGMPYDGVSWLLLVKIRLAYGIVASASNRGTEGTSSGEHSE